MCELKKENKKILFFHAIEQKERMHAMKLILGFFVQMTYSLSRPVTITTFVGQYIFHKNNLQ